MCVFAPVQEYHTCSYTNTHSPVCQDSILSPQQLFFSAPCLYTFCPQSSIITQKAVLPRPPAVAPPSPHSLANNGLAWAQYAVTTDKPGPGLISCAPASVNMPTLCPPLLHKCATLRHYYSRGAAGIERAWSCKCLCRGKWELWH